MAKIVFNNVYKRYTEDVTAVKDFSLEIDDEEFVVFVGPSGCGKSTSLRMLAGLEDITEGEIYIDDVLINDVEPKNRGIAMVFQNYALYPHMTVYDNMAFALKLKKVSKEKIEEKVKAAAEILGLNDFLNRKPKTLSGGQRQRVALGRAIVRDAKAYLMDEPLSNLDAKLRVETRAEIISLHKRLKANIIYVTHDQTEAMTMGDRIVVMNKGEIQQVDTPEEIYTHPKNLFVASFIGSPQMNFFKCKLKKDENYFIFESNNKKIAKFNMDKFPQLASYNKNDIILGIRSENLSATSVEEGNFNVNVTLVEMLGSDKYIYSLDNYNGQIAIRSRNDELIYEGDTIGVNIIGSNIHFFDIDTELALY